MGINNRIGCLLAALALSYSAQARVAFAVKVQKDTTQTAKTDTAKVQKPNGKDVKAEPKKKETDYDKLMKDSGTVMKGLFTVRTSKTNGTSRCTTVLLVVTLWPLRALLAYPKDLANSAVKW